MEQHDGAGDEVVLFVLIHGNNGHASDWAPLTEVIQRRVSAPHSVYCFQSHPGKQTLVGVDELARVLVEEVLHHCTTKLQYVATIRLYLIGHSLGGLVGRRAAPLLLARDSRFQPLGYCSICSPHVGCARPGGGVIKSTWKHMTELACKHLYKQTGGDLLLTAAHGEDIALEETALYRMSDPNGECMQALARFPHRTMVAAPFHDMVVPFPTASAQPFNPYNEEEYLQASSSHHPLVVWGFSKSFTERYANVLAPFSRADAHGKPDAIPEEMQWVVNCHGHHSHEEWHTDRYRFSKWPKRVMDNLNTISFRRLDVQLHLPSRWAVHDGFLKKRAPVVFSDLGPGCDAFMDVFVSILALDIVTLPGTRTVDQ